MKASTTVKSALSELLKGVSFPKSFTGRIEADEPGMKVILLSTTSEADYIQVVSDSKESIAGTGRNALEYVSKYGKVCNIQTNTWKYSIIEITLEN